MTPRCRFHSAGHHPVSSTRHRRQGCSHADCALSLRDDEKAEAVRRLLAVRPPDGD